jgi:hypothetical protein
MILRKLLFLVCLIVSVLCLAGGYAFAGHWPGVGLAVLAGPGWLLARKYPAAWLQVICLLASVSLAGAGMLTGSPAVLMMCGSAFALAAWDLLLLDGVLGKDPFGVQVRQYENSHLQTLALALGSGLLAALLGHSLSLQTPFYVLAVLVILMLFGLNRIWGSLKKTGEL